MGAASWDSSLYTEGCCLGTKGLSVAGPERVGLGPGWALGTPSLFPGARGRKGGDMK